MRRRLFNVACAASLLLSMAVGALWVRSYWISDVWEVQRGWQNPDGSYECRGIDVYAQRGRVQVAYAACYFRRAWVESGQLDRDLWKSHVGHAAVEDPSGFGPPANGWQWAGVQWDRYAPRGGFLVGGGDLTLPCWLILAVAAGPLAAWSWRRARTRRRVRHGLCRHCGYDLRASPEHCPECGSPAEAKA